MRIISRAEWKARHDNGFGSRRLPATEVWLHHSVTIAPDLIPPFDDDYAAIRTLEQIGENRFGKGISYTWLVTPAGLIFEGHSVDRVGSHTANHNTVACGLCLVGSYDTAEPTRAQLRAAAWLLQHARDWGWIDAARLDGGHRDLKATSCPGQHAYDAIPTINELAAGGPIIEEEDMGHVDSISLEAADAIATRILWRDSDPDPDQDVPVWIAINGIRDQVDAIKAVVDELKARPAADVDESQLAAELQAHGGLLTAAEFIEILNRVGLRVGPAA